MNGIDFSRNFFKFISSSPIPLGCAMLSPSTNEVQTEDPDELQSSGFLLNAQVDKIRRSKQCDGFSSVRLCG